MDRNDDETVPDTWYGWDWANPNPEEDEQMREALFDHCDDEAEIEAAMAYLDEVDRALDEDRHYTGEQIAELFKTRVTVEYENWAKVAEPWIDDHYSGLLTDPTIRAAFGASITEWEDDLGRVIAAADSTRYWWHETDSGMVVAVLRPGYTDEMQ
jgi:hypothetical protein